MPTVIGSLTQHPARALFRWYAVAIVLGGLILMLPICRAADAKPISLLDAIFTSASATCVTGLTVRSTAHDFSRFGQLVILLLIQLGGIGIMTVTTFVTFQWRVRQGIRERALIAETLGDSGETDLRKVLVRVLRWTAILEACGAVVLFLRFQANQSPFAACWQALFTSVSAFCNAGFSLHDDSLTAYQGDAVVNPAIMMLVVTGGIGYPVLVDVARNWSRDPRQTWEKLMLHSKIMLMGSAVLIAIGTFAFLVFESDGVLASMPYSRRLMVAMFHSVSCRTAGFNTVDLGSLTNATLFVSILLMIVGAGPCSTGGGFKVSTLTVLLLRAWATLSGRPQISVGRRTLPASVVERAMVTAFVFAAVAVTALAILLALEQSSSPHTKSLGLFMDASFEVFSALGTVGLSTGLTPQLNPAGRVIIVLLMFMGRLGPITLFAALSRERKSTTIQYANESPLIG